MIATSDSTSAINLISFEGDGIDAVALHVRRCEREVPAHAGLAEDLLHRLRVLRLEAQFGEEGDRVGRVGRGGVHPDWDPRGEAWWDVCPGGCHRVWYRGQAVLGVLSW